MSQRPLRIRDQRLKSIPATSSNLNLTSRSNLKNSSVPKDLSSTSIRRQKIPVLQVANISTATETNSTSKRKLAALVSTRAIKKINLSMYSPSNSILKSSRSRITQTLSLPQKALNKFPMTSVQALESFKDWLNEFERNEIMGYKEIFYIGFSIKRPIDLHSTNFGFDSEKGDYKVSVSDHIDYRYEILAMIGKGSFGQVCRCFDHKNKELVAVKIIRNKKRFQKQALVEAKLLINLREKDPADHNNIIRIKSHFMFRKHVCIVFELLSMNLYEFMKLNGFQKLNLNLVARIAVQLLLALNYTASLGIIHCDLKPENILLKSPQKSGIKIIDFGSGCYETERIYTYIQSRFYRAPEVMLGIPYTTSIDMWSFACVIAEIYNGRPLFPGESEHDQMLRIMEAIGVPPEGVLELSSRRRVFFDSNDNPRIVPNSRGKLRYPLGRSIEQALDCDDSMFVDFIRSILCWDPQIRPKPEEALDHPWLIRIFNRQPSPVKKRRTVKSFLELSELKEV